MMNLEKILIAYASRYGSTETIAIDIEKALNDNGLITQRIDLTNIRFRDLDPISSYKGVIIGSSVAMFRVHPAFKKFLKAMKKDLRSASTPLILYVASGTAISDPEKAHEKWIQKYVDKFGLKPALSQAIAPCMTMSASTKKNIKGICKTLTEQAGKEFVSVGMNDLRDKERFGTFLKNIVEIVK